MRLLFIAWDGPYVNYLDGLFLPIFAGLRPYGFEFHVLHFTWADEKRIDLVSEACRKQDIPYQHVKIWTKPLPVIGKYLTLLAGRRRVLSFIDRHRIEGIMPRALMPAQLALGALQHRPDLKVIFDADGLPIEERVDFAGLKKDSFRYRELKKIEKHIVERSNVILARTSGAIEVLVKQYGEIYRHKFFKVVNGRDESVFRKAPIADGFKLRESLGIPPDAFVYVYCGSLGPQYGAKEMTLLHERLRKSNPNSYWLILTGNPGYFLKEGITPGEHVVILNVQPGDVPGYLSIGDVGFALRKATYSMQGVSPIKIGEYLLIGLPVVASAGIGDTEAILKDKPFCFILKDFEQGNLELAATWISKQKPPAHVAAARMSGETHFGLGKSIESYLTALKFLRGQN